jgi:endonuclease-3
VVSLRARRARARKVVEILRREFPDSMCSLEHVDPWQLLVATILSAQCTDVRVNLVTPAFFARFPELDDVAGADPAEVAEVIRSTGFYRNKTKSLQGAARAIAERHGGRVPGRMDALLELPGVGRKTANVVLGEIWGRPDGVVVDTHVGRISLKLGLTDQPDPVKIEAQLAEAIDRKDWRDYGHLVIDHGRRTCRARAPRCDACPIYAHCEVRA